MWADNETTEDLLGFQVHANLIKELVTDQALLPLTVGVYGDWGSGKSSVMKMVQKSLDESENDGHICLYFNGWMFEGYDDAKSALIESILLQLIKHKKLKDKIGDTAKDLLKSVDWFRAGSFLLKNVAIPGIKAYATGGLSVIPDAVAKLGNAISNIGKEDVEKLSESLGDAQLMDEIKLAKESFDKNSSFGNIPKTVREFRSKFEELLEKTEITSLVILIDDLDRCSPERIIDNLEAIKLFLNVKGTAFVIGADERIVRHAIEHRYKSLNFTSNEITEYGAIITDYLEKLIQIPLRLPKLSSSDVETYMSMLICKRDLPKDSYQTLLECFKKFRLEDKHSVVSYEKIREFLPNDVALPKDLSVILQIASLISQSLKGNPRQIKRFLNAFMLRKKLGKVAGFELQSEVLAKLMALEYTKLNLFQQLNEWQQKQGGRALALEDMETQVENSKKVENDIYKDWDNVPCLKWLQIEPKLGGVDLGDYFWISRDKITESVDGANLYPTQVRRAFKELMGFTTNASLKKKIEKSMQTLTETGQSQLYEYMNKNIMSHPENG